MTLLDELEHERAVLARLIVRYGEGGEKFLPVFDRYDRECADLRQKEDSMQRVRRLAAASSRSDREPTSE